jgi:DNA-binding transcriptional ArsR family regulator
MIEKKNHVIIEKQAALFGVLADPTRLKLLKLLAQQREPNALCVNALAYQLGVTQSAISQHLRVLKSAGMVKGEKRGYRVHYFVNKDTLKYSLDMASDALDVDKVGNERTGQELTGSDD